MPILSNSEENLRAALGKMRLNNRAVEDVMDKVRSRHYQVGYYQLSINLISGGFVDMLVKLCEQMANLYAVGMHVDI